MKKYFLQTFKIVKNEKGFTIMEAVVAAGIFAVGILGYMTYNKMLSNAEREVSDSISATRVLNTVINDLKSDNRYIIPIDMDPDEALFEDTTVSAERCYDRLGGRLFLTDEIKKSETLKDAFIEEDCIYHVKFYKTKVNHLNSGVKQRIPLSQIHIKIRYFQGTVKNRRPIVTTLSPFVVNTAHF